MTLDSWMYGDPERVAIRREGEKQAKERKCGDCIHKLTAVVDGETLHRCEFRNKIYGVTRCELYRKKI